MKTLETSDAPSVLLKESDMRDNCNIKLANGKTNDYFERYKRLDQYMYFGTTR
jgi:hypothetical protein